MTFCYKIEASENKNKKTLKKVWKLSEKVLIFASAFAKKAGAAEAT
ncbi:hypothetical protein CW3_4955, partial [Bacteroides xylanisolvens SD CC 1b]